MRRIAGTRRYNIIRPLLLRIAIAVIPLSGWYLYSEMAFKANRIKEHPTDVGLGMVILLFLICIILFVGFAIDFIIRMRSEDKQIANIDLAFIILFAVPILYFFFLM